jgi:hypothetical protein
LNESAIIKFPTIVLYKLVSIVLATLRTLYVFVIFNVFCREADTKAVDADLPSLIRHLDLKNLNETCNTS